MRRSPQSLLAGLVLAAVAALGGAPTALGEPAGSQTRSVHTGRIDAGLNHSCAITARGQALCWGSDEFGQLGNDGAFGVGIASVTPLPVALPAGRTATAISAGNAHTCATLDDGSAWCWGRDDEGQLGNNVALTSSGVPVRVPLPTGTRAVSISAANRHSCAALDDGTAWCWGTEGSGEMGDANEAFGVAPTPVQALLPAGVKATAVSVGGDHSCAVLSDGSIWCWGADYAGQLGTDIADPPMGEAQIRVEPVRVQLPAGVGAVAVSAGRSTTCAISNTATAWCWGADSNGQLGDNPAYVSKSTPQQVTLLRDVSAISTASAETGDHTCVIWSGGSLACWGQDDRGQVGDDDQLGSISVPVGVRLPGAQNAAAVATGGSHTCATLDDGSLTCWGYDASGQLGNGPDPTTRPVAATAPAALAAGTMASRLVDVSLTASGLPATLRTTRPARVTLTVRNAGPDAATGLRVAIRASGGLRVLRGPGLEGTGTSMTWRVPTVAAGGQVQLQVTVVSYASGTGRLVAEVAGSDGVDVDSTPGDAATGGDDLASATTRVSGPRRVVVARTGLGVRAIGNRYVVRALSLSNLMRDDSVAVRCLRGCRLARTQLANGTRVNLTSLFRTVRPSVGAAIEVRVTAPGAIGRSIRISLGRGGAVTRRECRIQPNRRLTNCVTTSPA